MKTLESFIIPQLENQGKFHLDHNPQTCGYPDWAFAKTTTHRRKETAGRTKEQEREDRLKSVVIPYVAGVSEKVIFNKQHFPVFSKPSHTLSQRLVPPKDPSAHGQKRNLVYAVKRSDGCSDRSIGESKQPVNKRMSQHRRANSSGLNSAVFLHLKKEGRSFLLTRRHTVYAAGVIRSGPWTVNSPGCPSSGATHTLSSFPLLITSHDN